MNERTYQCRRSKVCKAWIPESSIEWVDESGTRRPVCKPGTCPNGKRNDTSEELLALQLEARRLRADARDAKASEDHLLDYTTEAHPLPVPSASPHQRI